MAARVIGLSLDADHADPCAAQRDRTGAGDRHAGAGPRHPRRGDACRSWASACRRPQPSLGTLIRIGNDFLFSGEWWVTIFPGIALVLMVLSINLLGDWLRDALNPRLR